MNKDNELDKEFREYKSAKKYYRQSKLSKEQFYTIRVKLFNATTASINYDAVFKVYKETEDDDNDVLNSRIKYKLGLHYLSGVGCKQDINNGYKKIVEASKFHLPDAKYWIKENGGEKDHGAEVAKKLLYKDEYDKLKQNLKNRYEKENNGSEYVRLGLARYCIRRKMFDEALKLLNEVGQLQDKEISSQKEKLIKDVTKHLK
ncbi:34470_t:CDS:1 [Gigaspora margarita]|uniref:34470_t:CDS:1 n=1 Tax=Gigaspora margarita TaxID=4874 RepID=A0ABN7X5H8_GIGMA|nr:34470_t:CDS:1 [Gigaspora margarita]